MFLSRHNYLINLNIKAHLSTLSSKGFFSSVTCVSCDTVSSLVSCDKVAPAEELSLVGGAGAVAAWDCFWLS